MKNIKLLVSLSSVAIDAFTALAKDGGLQEDPTIEIAQNVEVGLRDILDHVCGWKREEACNAVFVKVDDGQPFATAYSIFKDMTETDLELSQYEINGRKFSGTEFMEIFKDGPITALGLSWTPVQMMSDDWWYGWAGSEYGQWTCSPTEDVDLFFTPKALREKLWPNETQRHFDAIEEYRYVEPSEDNPNELQWRTIVLPDWNR